MDEQTLLSSGVSAMVNLGGFGIMLKWYAKKVDNSDEKLNQHAVLLAQTTSNQLATAETLHRLQSEVTELFESRNAHEKELAKINTLHEVKDCKTFYQQGVKR